MILSNSKKRLIAVVTAIIMTFGCASQAMAAYSYNKDAMDPVFRVSVVTSASTKSGSSVSVDSVSASDVNIPNVTGNDAAKAAIFTDLKIVSKASNSAILVIFKTSVPGIDNTNGTDVDFGIKRVNKDDNIIVWHWDALNQQWESNCCKVIESGDNHIRVNMKNDGIIAIVRGGTAETNASSGTVASVISRTVDENDAASQIKGITSPTRLTVRMDSTRTNVNMIKEAIANANVKYLIMNMTASIGNIQWTINRGNFTSASDVAQMDLDVIQSATAVPAATVKSVASNNEVTQQVELAHNGDFKGFSRAQLTMTAPSNVKAGMIARLYYYNNGALTLESTGLVDSSHKFRVLFRHGSQYVIVYAASKSSDGPEYDRDLMDPAFNSSEFNFSNVTTKVGEIPVKTSTIDEEIRNNGTKNIGTMAYDAPIDINEIKAVLWTDLKKTSNASKILAIFNCIYGDLDDVNGTELVFYVNDIKEGDDIKMWHWDKDRLQWENSSCAVTKVSYNHVYAKVKKLSPIAFVKGGKAAGSSSTTENNSARNTSTKSAPKTGE